MLKDCEKKKNAQNLNEFLEKVNKLDSITMETEIEKKLPFFDVDSLRIDLSLSSKVYRKTIKSSAVIPFQSESIIGLTAKFLLFPHS